MSSTAKFLLFLCVCYAVHNSHGPEQVRALQGSKVEKKTLAEAMKICAKQPANNDARLATAAGKSPDRDVYMLVRRKVRKAPAAPPAARNEELAAAPEPTTGKVDTGRSGGRQSKGQAAAAAVPPQQTASPALATAAPDAPPGAGAAGSPAGNNVSEVYMRPTVLEHTYRLRHRAPHVEALFMQEYAPQACAPCCQYMFLSTLTLLAHGANACAVTRADDDPDGNVEAPRVAYRCSPPSQARSPHLSAQAIWRSGSEASH